MFEQIQQNVWVVQKPFTLYRQNIGSRMTIVRLRDGQLWLHSPVKLSSEEHLALTNLGPIAHLVAPNLMHHLALPEYVQTYPEAQVYGPRGFEGKRPDIAFKALHKTPTVCWRGEIEFLEVEGSPDLNELVFLHLESRTLIVADLALHLHHFSGPIGALLARANQSYKTFGPSRICKMYIKDERKLAGSIQKLLQWDFDRVILSHGEILERGGREKIRSAYSWLQ